MTKRIKRKSKSPTRFFQRFRGLRTWLGLLRPAMPRLLAVITIIGFISIWAAMTSTQLLYTDGETSFEKMEKKLSGLTKVTKFFDFGTETYPQEPPGTRIDADSMEGRLVLSKLDEGHKILKKFENCLSLDEESMLVIESEANKWFQETQDVLLGVSFAHKARFLASEPPTFSYEGCSQLANGVKTGLDHYMNNLRKRLGHHNRHDNSFQTSHVKSFLPQADLSKERG